MTTDAAHKILFEPVQIGPKTTRNRFCQGLHCNGMGHRWPRTMAVNGGHEFARTLEGSVGAAQPFRRENDFEAQKYRPTFGGNAGIA